MKPFSAKAFTADRAWGSSLLGDFGDVAVRLHWTDQPYRWHRNTGREVFAVLEGVVDMHYREDGVEQVVRLHAGDGVSVEDGDEHVAHPVGAARILVVERKDSE
ncbi:mannose-6-phosphate isomerase-like protein (cupin superfamily) [Sphingomonas sp. BE270]|jgi:mannose-6-phosphate isomerase-like protein (cupin superfamily)|uniref:cupin n=1 Tax=unclassified Sphingomonas TaxID=196159 RepID=UPI0010FA2C53|nr:MULTISPECIES: cupin [unclassified Sphingomonas]MDR6849769.1 mannose-6-phosphate isomerase-like protein (cupin superfamily) [Sphingomonas sp. BE137]MDR7257270.1 mannose-6-phosphate isomerase-like protein (cupin superfamily) [Sphingomonas sp. BE270]